LKRQNIPKYPLGNHAVFPAAQHRTLYFYVKAAFRYNSFDKEEVQDNKQGNVLLRVFLSDKHQNISCISKHSIPKCS